MLSAEQLQWIKQRTWARYLFCMAIWLVIGMVAISLPFFIMLSGIWQHSHVPHKFLLWGGASLLLGFLVPLLTTLVIALAMRLSKKSITRLRAYTRQRLLSTLPVPELALKNSPVGTLQIYTPLQYFPPTILIYFLKKKRLLPWLCIVDGTPRTSMVLGECAQLTLPVGSHEIRLVRLALPRVNDEPKEMFCSKAVSIEIREDRPVMMVYKFKNERLLISWGAVILTLWLVSWNPYGWFEACFGIVNTGFPPPWNAPVFNDYVRVLLGELCASLILLASFRWGMRLELEVIKPDSAPPSL